MKKILLSITSIMLFSTNNCAQQNKMKIEDIKEIWVYNYFTPKGYRIGEVRLKFQELENNKMSKIQLDSTFVDSLKNMLIYSAKHKKMLLDNSAIRMGLKCGINLVFAQFVLKDGSSRNIIIASNGVFDYFVGNTGYFFIESSDDQNKTMWINRFFNKLVDRINAN
jgi:hypothetical protein